MMFPKELYTHDHGWSEHTNGFPNRSCLLAMSHLYYICDTVPTDTHGCLGNGVHRFPNPCTCHNNTWVLVCMPMGQKGEQELVYIGHHAHRDLFVHTYEPPSMSGTSAAGRPIYTPTHPSGPFADAYSYILGTCITIGPWAYSSFI